MKKAIALLLSVLVFASAQAKASEVKLPISKKNKAAIEALIAARIHASEKESGSNEYPIDISASLCMTNQVKSERGGEPVLTLLACSTGYNVERWNGQMQTVFKVEDGMLTEVVYEYSSGNF